MYIVCNSTSDVAAGQSRGVAVSREVHAHQRQRQRDDDGCHGDARRRSNVDVARVVIATRRAYPTGVGAVTGRADAGGVHLTFTRRVLRTRLDDRHLLADICNNTVLSVIKGKASAPLSRVDRAVICNVKSAA